MPKLRHLSQSIILLVVFIFVATGFVFIIPSNASAGLNTDIASAATIDGPTAAECQPFDFSLVPSFYVGTNTFTYTKGDFNADGKIDFAAVNAEVQTVSVLFGDGDGGFGPPLVVPVMLNPWSLTAGDLNNDGKADLVVGSFYENKLSIILNNGSGGFLAPVVVVPPAPSQGQFTQLRTADFNADGNIDIAAVQNQQGKQIRFFLGDGQGHLSAQTAINVVGDDTIAEVVDLNIDGISDLVLSGGSSFVNRYIAFIYGNPTATFSLTNGFAVADKPVGIGVGLFNNDALLDIAVAFEDQTTPTTHNIRVWRRTGNIFLPTTFIDLTYQFPPSGLTVGDFDNDGKLDLAAPLGSNNFSGVFAFIIHGNGDGTFTNHEYWTIPHASSYISTAEVNGDGRVDLVFGQSYSSNNNALSVLINNNYQGFRAPKPTLFGGTDIVGADMNNDTLADMVTATDTDFSESEVVIALNSLQNGLLADHNFLTPQSLRAIVAGDFNNDGKIDIASTHTSNANKVAAFLGDGAGNLGSPFLLSWNNSVENALAGDFNNDGKTDLFIIDGSSHGYTLLSLGNGSFAPVAGFFINATYYLPQQKGDFNEDGKIDLLTSTGSSITLQLGNGDGTFTAGATFALTSLESIAAGDFNGDVNLDFAVISTSLPSSLNVFYGNGNGTFSEPLTQLLAGRSMSLITGDFNLDGRDDLASVLESNQGNLQILASRTTPTNSFTPIYFSVGGFSLPSAGFRTALATADYNGDNKPDIGYTNNYVSRGVIYNTSGERPCISISDVSIPEGDTGTTNAVFNVTLSQPVTETVRVNYQLNAGTATVGTDLQTVSGRLAISPGQTTTTINVPIMGDVSDEFDETFAVNLSSPLNASIGKFTGSGGILDDDPEPTLTINDISRNEGSSSTQYNFQVTLSAPSGKSIPLRFSTADGTAVNPEDYFAVNVNTTIQPGATSASFGVTVPGDNTHEPDENFFANISETSNVTVIDGQGIGSIFNDDPMPSVSILGTSAAEGNSGTVNRMLFLQLSNPTYLPVGVDMVTADGTAIGGLDYVSQNSHIVIPAGQMSVNPTVGIIGDTIDEPNESFTVDLNNISNATVGTIQATVTIIDDDPAATPTPSGSPTLTPTPTGPTLSGSITYGNAIGAPTPRFVSNVTITGAGSPTVTAITSSPGPTAGQYLLSGFGAGSYTVTPSKTSGVNGAISSFDAAKIAQHVTGASSLTGNQLVVADATGNGTLSSLDAAQLARYVAGLSGFGSTSNWVFAPVNRTYPSITNNITGEDYSALLMGEVSGNWNNTGARPDSDAQFTEGGGWSDIESDSTIVIDLPNVTAGIDKEIDVPVSVQGVVDKEVISYEFDLRYDPSVLTPDTDPVDLKGSVSRGLVVVTNAEQPGLLRVVMYGAIPINEDGMLLSLKFIAVGKAGSGSPLSFERFMFNEGLTMTATDGRVELR